MEIKEKGEAGTRRCKESLDPPEDPNTAYQPASAAPSLGLSKGLSGLGLQMTVPRLKGSQGVEDLVRVFKPGRVDKDPGHKSHSLGSRL